jgi:hypothetical protein
LLGLCGLWEKIILEKLNGKRRRVSFRNLVPFFFVRENSIIRLSSPIFKEKYKEETVELSVFRMLLTGRDDSRSIAPATDPKTHRIRLLAQVDLIEEFIARAESELATIPVLGGEETDLATFEATVRDEAQTVETLRETIAGIETERVAALREGERLSLEAADAHGLLERFELLQEHYRSDLARLDAIIDAGTLLALMPGTKCPLCGVPAREHLPSPEGTGAGPTPEEFHTACEAEKKKITSHERGLAVAIDDLAKRIVALDDRINKAAQKVAQLGTASESATRDLRRRAARLGDMFGRQAALERRAALEAQLAAFQSSRAARVLPSTPTSGKQVERLVDIAGELRAFCGFIRMLLDAWQFPERGAVSFDPTTFDLTIGGRPRSSFGKGLRAITHAAFTLALQLYCRERGTVHPGPVILDSPLVTLRKRNVRKREALPPDVKYAFFEDLATRNRGGQVLIFDNEAPPKNVADRVHAIFFDEEGGPYPGGFIPPRSPAASTSG